MKVKNILNNLDKIAPFFLQESFDNSGIQFVDLDASIIKILLSLDVTQDVLDEALENKVNLIIANFSCSRLKDCLTYSICMLNRNIDSKFKDFFRTALQRSNFLYS